ncbi:MAG TPA: DegT/DnrJ/EryC1/StrS family aminotransferase [Pirellulales bacterium]|nr:DegT/DnrJ/EryC1/StrS family aminotransferase [Pirellulales bacterium]
MWPRKRLDLGWGDLGSAAARCMLPACRRALAAAIESRWSNTGDALVCLSVRSAFDLLLSSLRLPPRSEMLISAVTIRDMATIIEAHGLVPVPIDLEVAGMAPRLESLEAGLTARTRAIVVAHLFGGRIDLKPIAEFARRHRLLLIEDAAQAFVGDTYKGNEAADASMFSFGPIKTATSLGGAVVRVRDADLLGLMRERQSGYPVQSRGDFLKRTMKYAALKGLSARPVFSAAVAGCRLARRDYDRLINGCVRGFGAEHFFQRIRRQPSAPLLSLLARRLAQYDPERLASRAQIAERIMGRWAGTARFPGSACQPHTHWLLPLWTNHPARIIATLAEGGFDATQGQSLTAIAPPDGRPETEPATARRTMSGTVFLPCYPGLPPSAVSRLAEIVQQECEEADAATTGSGGRALAIPRRERLVVG